MKDKQFEYLECEKRHVFFLSQKKTAVEHEKRDIESNIQRRKLASGYDFSHNLLRNLNFSPAIVYHNAWTKSSKYRPKQLFKLILNCASFRLVKTVLFTIVFYFTQWYNQSLTARLTETKIYR